MKNRLLAFFSILFLMSIVSCGYKTKAVQIDLKDSFYWSPGTRDETVEEVIAHPESFTKMDIHGGRNLQNLVGMKGAYVWLRSDFIIPSSLKNQPLGLMISYLHFSEKVYINGNYAGSYGEFPPDEHSPMYSARYYGFPEGVLNPDGLNTIYIKVWCHGRSAISDHVVITDMTEAKTMADLYSSNNSKIYIMFEGGMFSAFLIFLMIWIRRKHERENIYFSLLCLASMFLTTPFFQYEVPWYVNMSHLLLTKVTICSGMCCIAYLVASFTIKFIKREENRISKIVRFAIWAGSMLVCWLAPTYNFLIDICPAMFAVQGLQVCFGFYHMWQNIRQRQNLSRTKLIMMAFVPLVTSIIADIIIKDVLYILDVSYMTMFGWQLSIISFLVILVTKYTAAANKSEYLAKELVNEVEAKTLHLQQVNENLEREKFRADADLKMAAIVQQKFFPYPNKKFRGWDIATCYSPCSKVSGDMYDYYNDENEELQGCSLFDVSGHGISASLITMLSKNIIFRAFRKSREEKTSVTEALYEIHDQINDAKGDIENYLTGLMFRFSNFDDNDEVDVQLANAGHPNPILYSSKSNIIAEIENSPDKPHYGAIGIKEIAISFPQIDFSMGNDDILVCYTDGLTEAMNRNREQFGLDRVKKIIRNSYAKNAQSILEDLIDGLYEFIGDAPREDDMTIMVLKREDSQNYIEEL